MSSDYVGSKEMATHIRTEVKRMIASGDLVLPPGVWVSVRKETGSMLIAVDVTLRGVPDDFAWAPSPVDPDSKVVSPQLQSVGDRISALGDLWVRQNPKMRFVMVYLDSGVLVSCAS